MIETESRGGTTDAMGFGESDSDLPEGLRDTRSRRPLIPPRLELSLRPYQIGWQLAVWTRIHRDPPE